MPHIQHARDDSRSNEDEALSILSTREGATMVSLSTQGYGAKLGCLDESFYHGVLFTGKNSDFAQQDHHLRATPDGVYSGSP